MVVVFIFGVCPLLGVSSCFGVWRWAGCWGGPFKRRREPIHGGLSAASMLRTLLKGPPQHPSRLPRPVRGVCRESGAGRSCHIQLQSIVITCSKPQSLEPTKPLCGTPSTDCAQQGCCAQAPMDGFMASPGRVAPTRRRHLTRRLGLKHNSRTQAASDSEEEPEAPRAAASAATFAA